MAQILIIKTGALGDVLRTTSILPGLAARHGQARIVWVTASDALDLLRLHPLLNEPRGEIVTIDDVASQRELAAAAGMLARREWERVISLDDEEPLCRLASAVGARSLSGAYLDAAGKCTYTPDAALWFDMGLLSVHGRHTADRLKKENRRSHPEILAAMLGIEMGRPQLVLEPRHERSAEDFARRHRLRERGAVVGLNTGAGGRWQSKALPLERTLEAALRVERELDGAVTFVLFGGAEERERNARIAASLQGRVHLADAGVDNALLDFAALVGLCDVLVTSDSLALHVALARSVRVVAFFAPTSAAEIELYGLGEKVASTAPDACSYRPDADTSTLTPERIARAAVRQVRAARRGGAPVRGE